MDNEIVELVKERIEIGYKKYGKEMPVDDGRDWVQETLEELLDACVYLANLLILIKKKRKN